MSGDVDMLPLVELALSRGWRVTVWTWKDSIGRKYRKNLRDKGVLIKYLESVEDEFLFVQSEQKSPRQKNLRYKYKNNNQVVVSDNNNSGNLVIFLVLAIALGIVALIFL